MSNWFDPKLTAEQKAAAESLVRELGLEKAFLRVRYNSSQNQLSFTQDRRVVDVPMLLIKNNQWNDIRFLFRAVLNAGPSSWNLSADKNDWSAYHHHTYQGDEG